MKYFLNIFFLSFCLNHLVAQEKHFVFIQSDNNQPFYVSLNSKLFSSSASGYLIIPKLTEGTYNFTIGFGQNAYPEQTFTCAIQNKDLGFNLKNFNEKGWGLFNLQTLDITMATTANSNVVAKAIIESSSAKAPEPVISFEKKKEPEPAPTKVADTLIDNAVTKVEGEKDAVPKADAVVAAPSTNLVATTTDKGADVKKVSEVAGEEGVRLSYVEGSGKKTDTINVMIPSSPSSETPNKVSAANVKPDSLAISATPVANNSDIKFLDINMAAKKDTANVTRLSGEPAKIMENSNCKNIATEEDYAKLRKKMASETSDEKMISEAKKSYRNKCFTTSQIKGLSTLFLSDEGRLKFFDASFVSVADASNYPALQTEFIDPAFISRFKSLLQ